MKQIDKLQREGEIEKILERFEKQFEADRNTCSDYLDVVKDFFRKELSSLIERDRKVIRSKMKTYTIEEKKLTPYLVIKIKDWEKLEKNY